MRHFFQLSTLSNLHTRPLAVGLVGLVWLMLALPGSAQVTLAQFTLAQFTPPDQGLPGRREGGGTRGGCLSQQPSLTALMPQNNLGLTLAAHPSFFWYVPQTSAAAAEFVLLDANDTELYKAQVPLSQQAGVVQFTLPDDAPELQVNQSYRWYFSLVCQPLDRSADIFTSGWVKRVEAGSGQTGLWYDDLARLAVQRQEQPQNAASIAQWQTMLESVGLEQIADQPLL